MSRLKKCMAITKKISSTLHLQDLLLMKLEAIYDIEKELVTALSKLEKKATDEELSEAFKEHLTQTHGHVERIEKAFFVLDKKPAKMKSAAIRGLIDDAEWLISNVEDLRARDVSMIRSAQSVEHYEISSYEAALDWARTLGFKDISDLLEKNLIEEELASARLTEISNRLDEAASGDDTEKVDEEME